MLRYLTIAVFRILALAIALLAAGCARPTTWFLESDNSGIIRVRLDGKRYTAFCVGQFVPAKVTIHEGPSACEIPAGLLGKTILGEGRELRSDGKVVVTTLTKAGPQEHGPKYETLNLHRYIEGDPSGGIYESFRVVPEWFKPSHIPFIRPVYLVENA